MLFTLYMAALQGALAPSAIPVTPPASQFVLVDARSPKEKSGKNMNAWMFACSVGVIWIGDQGLGKQRIGGDRVQKLQRALSQRFGDRLRGHRLELTNYSFVINGAVNAESYGSDTVMRVNHPNGLPTIKPKCSREKMGPAWFDPSELTNSNTPLIAVLAGTFDGTPIAARAVKSPATQLTVGIWLMPFKFMDAAEFDGVLNDIGDQVGRAIAAKIN